MPINSPISPGVRNSDSPQLEFKGDLFNPDLSPDKKARPSPITPGLLTESTGFLCINTPTITPRTPRNPATPVTYSGNTLIRRHFLRFNKQLPF